MLDLKRVEAEVHKIWEKEKIPQKIVSIDWNRKKFFLLDGPPYVNGIPHVGHIKTTTFKDIWGKFKYMQGFAVWFQPGFDCGGLPIENKVEKDLKIESKKDIEIKIGIDKFIEACKDFAKGNEFVWLSFYKKMGAWRGWLNPYLTSENYYIESGWWTVKQLYEKGMFIEGFRPGFWCPHCETVLSGYEVTDSYKDIEDPSIFIKFPIKGKKSEFLLVWTTTPWTLPANVAVAVHPEESYVKVKVGEEHFILAKNRLDIFTELELGYIVEKEFKGKELEGIKYEPVINVPLQEELNKIDNCHKVVLSVPLMKKRVASKTKIKTSAEGEDEFGHIVDVESGTGLVHIAPGHGDVDNQLGKYYNLPEVSPVDERGCLTKEAGKFFGMFVKHADKHIIEELKKKGTLLYSTKIVHSYPLCWRCKTPLIYRMSKQWFLNTEKIRNKMIKENERIKWLPEFARERMTNLLSSAPDWAITRQRYWGIPTPVWVCEKCGRKKVIGSLEELKEHATEEVCNDLHKNSVDKIHLKCECGSTMTRIPDIMDVWFDSGIAPWASFGYPFRNKELFEKLWPVDLIDESQDQIRGWFYSLLFCSVGVFDRSSYETVCLNGWTLDEKGSKMSKSLGNVIMADEAYRELGADLLRLYYCYDTPPWETQKFSIKNAKELGRKLNILWNVYNYFRTYCKLEEEKGELKTEDKWILSRINTLIKKVTDDLENFRFHEASRSIVSFVVDEFSRTYVKLIRERADKEVNFVFSYTLNRVLRLLAPMTPFITDYIFYQLFKKSVHTEKWPDCEEGLINQKLEEEMKRIDVVLSIANSIRQEHNIKLRWSLPKITTNIQFSEDMKKIICKLGNFERIEIKDEEQPQKTENGTKVSLELKVDHKNALLSDVLRLIQQKRKEEGLVVSDKIELYLDCDELKEKEKEIKKRVGAKVIIFSGVEKPLGKVSVGGLEASFTFKKIE